jgi:hypothetical protein
MGLVAEIYDNPFGNSFALPHPDAGQGFHVGFSGFAFCRARQAAKASACCFSQAAMALTNASIGISALAAIRANRPGPIFLRTRPRWISRPSATARRSAS